MTKLQRRVRSEVNLPLALRAGVSSRSQGISPPPDSNVTSSGKMADSRYPLLPSSTTHRRAVSTPRAPQTQWPLIITSSPPSMAYPSSPQHDYKTCGANCTRCGKRKLIQLNSPPSKNIPSTAAPLRPIPQAHMRAVSDGVISNKSPKRLSVTTTPVTLTPGKKPCCQKCGRQKRPASVPMQSSSKQVQEVRVQIPPTHHQSLQNYGVLRANVSGSTAGTPHPSKIPSRSPSPPTPGRFYASLSNAEHVISPLSPRRKADFAPPSKASSSASSMPYSPLSPSDQETAEIGTGRLINLISNAIRETSPTASPPPTSSIGTHKNTHIHNRSTATDAAAAAGLGLLVSDLTSFPSDEDARVAWLSRSRSPVDTHNPFEAIELDSVPIGDATADILSNYAYDDEKASDYRHSNSSMLPLTDTGARRDEAGEWSEYGYDWTDAVSIPIIRLPSVKEGISRFKSLRGGGSQSSVGRRSSVKERFGSLRGNTREGALQQPQGWYGGLSRSGSKYQALESNVEVDVY